MYLVIWNCSADLCAFFFSSYQKLGENHLAANKKKRVFVLRYNKLTGLYWFKHATGNIWDCFVGWRWFFHIFWLSVSQYSYLVYILETVCFCWRFNFFSAINNLANGKKVKRKKKSVYFFPSKTCFISSVLVEAIICLLNFKPNNHSQSVNSQRVENVGLLF